MNSRFITEVELPELFNAQRKRRLRVLPVFIGCVPKDVIEKMGLLDLQGFGSPDKPIGSWSPAHRDIEIWKGLYETLKSILDGR